MNIYNLLFQAVVLSVLLAAITAAPAEEKDEGDMDFSKFQKKFSKNYNDGEERTKRVKNFEGNRKFIAEFNRNKAASPFTLDINDLADLSQEEMKSTRFGLLSGEIIKNIHAKATPGKQRRAATTFPDALDWRTKNAVSGVKNQGSCGSCWAFASTGALESRMFLKNNQSWIVSLSEQQLIDCSRSFGNIGCQGGLMHNAFGYVSDFGGINKAISYVYTGREGGCSPKPDDKQATLKTVLPIMPGRMDVAVNDENALIEALQSGPVAVAVDATTSKFQFYKSGIYECSTKADYGNLNHAVLAVGYSSTHWIIKNSWGTGWGENGFMRLTRTKDKDCGILMSATYPTLA